MGRFKRGTVGLQGGGRGAACTVGHFLHIPFRKLIWVGKGGRGEGSADVANGGGMRKRMETEGKEWSTGEGRNEERGGVRYITAPSPTADTFRELANRPLKIHF